MPLLTVFGKGSLSRLILLNKIGSKKNAWLPRPSEWIELTSARSLSPSFLPKLSGCMYGWSVDITWAFYLCGHKFAPCAAFV